MFEFVRTTPASKLRRSGGIIGIFLLPFRSFSSLIACSYYYFERYTEEEEVMQHNI